MTMAEVEADILRDLRELGDEMSQYSYLIGCAQEGKGFPCDCRTESYRVKECQSKAWLVARWENNVLYFRGDSDSLIVKGALALLEEICDGRTREEVYGYRCGLLQDDVFIRHFTSGQREGLAAALALVRIQCD